MGSEIARRARWMTGAVATAGSALHSAAFLTSTAGTDPLRSALCGALSAGVLTALLFALVQRTTIPALSAVFALAGAAVAGGLNAGLSMFLLGLATNDPRGLERLPEVALIGGIFGFFIGMPYGVALSVPAALSAWTARAPSHAWSAWLGLGLGVWLGITALWARWLPYSITAELVLSDVSSSLIALGFGAAAVSIVRLAYRARWLARVRRGRVPGHAIVPAAAMTDDLDALPWCPFSSADAILVREHVAGGGAYRGVVSREAIALVSDSVAANSSG